MKPYEEMFSATIERQRARIEELEFALKQARLGHAQIARTLENLLGSMKVTQNEIKQTMDSVRKDLGVEID